MKGTVSAEVARKSVFSIMPTLSAYSRPITLWLDGLLESSLEHLITQSTLDPHAAWPGFTTILHLRC
jgi:hypothetical protein